MADKKISQLTAATTPLAGTEVLPIVQSSTTKKVAVSDLTAGRAVSVASLDSAGNATFGSASAGLTQIAITTTGEAADQKDWRFQTGVGIGAGRLRLRTVNDAVSDGQTAWTADRTGVNVNTQGWYTSGAERLAIDDSYVFVRTGSLKIGTAGQGIDFSADGQAAGMTSELLDDYEEGTFTPVLTFGGNSADQTYSVQIGRYTKIGRSVHVQVSLIFTNKGTSTGDAAVTLPFALAEALTPASFYFAAVTHDGFMQGFADVGEAFVRLQSNSDAGATGNLADTNFANNSRVYMSITYNV